VRSTNHQPSHSLEPLGQCSDLLDGGIAFPEPEVRPETIILTCVRHGAKANLRGGLVVRRSGEGDGAAWFARWCEVCVMESDVSLRNAVAKAMRYDTYSLDKLYLRA
jgi:hypothetical protein